MSEETQVEETQVEEIKLDTTNPFNKGVSYEMFLKNIKGQTTVDKLLKKHKLTESQIDFIKRELKNYKKEK